MKNDFYKDVVRFLSIMEVEFNRLKEAANSSQKTKKQSVKNPSTVEDTQLPLQLDLGWDEEKLNEFYLTARTYFSFNSAEEIREYDKTINRPGVMPGLYVAPPATFNKAELARHTALRSMLHNLSRPELAEVLVTLRGSTLTEKEARKIRRSSWAWIYERVMDYKIL